MELLLWSSKSRRRLSSVVALCFSRKFVVFGLQRKSRLNWPVEAVNLAGWSCVVHLPKRAIEYSPAVCIVLLTSATILVAICLGKKNQNCNLKIALYYYSHFYLYCKLNFEFFLLSKNERTV